ncbi:G-type lectin S-receptor-like serine/threonine-protein kinase At1g34300 [Andrographis paniculata]|uniref:G-type lectin S-receptor-like serine/threonine-protein kinase At1g34300 n=1 Tax=Andrographis paniculata TaxID=175694 RepID=UPI0021E708B0|nr:G-type lectin S-receptor-like serine/threonine-protein kinase At1g34300 [Andrographis paniculata]
MMLSPLTLTILPFIFLFSACKISSQDVSPGSTLSASNPSQSWNSPNNSFSLSFVQESRDRYFAAVSYNGVPIWKAGGDPGGAVDSSASLQFLANGNLQLVTRTGLDLIWESNTSGLGITSASLDNSGNFVLKNGTRPVWTTFDHPTDTIIPEQNFTTNHVLRCGLYSFRLADSGEISLSWNDSVKYYNTSSWSNSTADLNLTSPRLGLQPVGIFELRDSNLSSPVAISRGNDYGETSGNPWRFVKLDCDGNLRMYSSSSASGRGSKTETWAALEEQCQVFGYCGDLGVCRYDEITGNPTCGCLSENFDLIDTNDARKGCKRKVDLQNCQPTLLTLNHTLFLTSPSEFGTDYFTGSITACSSNCLQDATCIASSSLADGSGVYYMKRSGLISGYQSPTISSTSFMKICGNPEPYPPPSSASEANRKAKRLRIVAIALGIAMALAVLAFAYLWFYNKSRPQYETILPHYSFSDYASGVPLQFSYKELQKETKNFKEKIGGGGFGSVYRGVLPNKIVVAVKQLEGIGQGEKQFRMEVATISSTHHLNLVRLVGFCSEGRHRLLVYEFMKNGSLDSFLFDTEMEPKLDKEVLNWARRYSIALGTAKGITYLHEECRDCILHCDIKPENILLDENYNARISDFGLARLLNLNDHRHRSIITVRGTRGYLAPEWVANLPITSKADVYGYGMVLLEIVSGRRNFEVSAETNQKRFSLWAYEEIEKGNIGAVLDKRLAGDDVDIEQAARLIQVSFWCIQEQPSLRPAMGKVVQMLEGIAEVYKPPPPMAMIGGMLQSGTETAISSSQITAISSLVSES